jgi:hypothetical protein
MGPCLSRQFSRRFMQSGTKDLWKKKYAAPNRLEISLPKISKHHAKISPAEKSALQVKSRPHAFRIPGEMTPNVGDICFMQHQDAKPGKATFCGFGVVQGDQCFRHISNVMV